MSLIDKNCVPCREGDLPITGGDIPTYLEQLTKDWEVIGGQKIQHEFVFENFVSAMEFVNKVADVAQQQGHHPDIHIVSWNKVVIDLWTHDINGLSENDFIVAAHIEKI